MRPDPFRGGFGQVPDQDTMIIRSRRLDRQPLEHGMVHIRKLDERHIGGDIEQPFHERGERHGKKQRQSGVEGGQPKVLEQPDHRHPVTDQLPHDDAQELREQHRRNDLEIFQTVSDIARTKARDEAAKQGKQEQVMVEVERDTEKNAYKYRKNEAQLPVEENGGQRCTDKRRNKIFPLVERHDCAAFEQFGLQHERQADDADLKSQNDRIGDKVFGIFDKRRMIFSYV